MRDSNNEVSRVNQLLQNLEAGKLNLSMDDAVPPEELGDLGLPPQETSAEISVVSEGEESVEQSEASVAEDLNDSEADSDLSVSPEDSSDVAAATAVEDILEIKVTGPKGPQKVKVDLSDKEKLKNYVRLAHGARKWQKERDDARQEFKKATEELTSFKTDWQKIEEAFKTDGVKGLVNLLEKSEDAYDKFLESELKNRKEWETLSPSQQEIIKQRSEMERARRDQERLRADYESKLNAIQAEKEQVFEKQLEAKIHPAFDRYRFAGKLNDSVAEAEFDEMLWNKVLTKLDSISEKTDLNQAIIDREFRTASQALSKHLNRQVEAAVKTTIDNKKAQAATKVQAVVKKGLSTTNQMDNMRSKVKSGNLTDALADFFKLGGKVK